MTKVISYTLIIIIYVIFIYLAVKNYKKSETFTERILYLLFIFVFCVPVFIYLLDRYNIPSRVGYVINVDSAQWFNLIVTYVSTVTGSIISGVILLLITIKQIDNQIENNNNDKRIQNAPVLDYTLTVNNKNNCDYNHVVKLEESGKKYHVYFKLENIGLNHCRNVSCKIIVDNKEDKEFFLNKKQSILRKDSSVKFDLVFELNPNNKSSRNVLIIIRYEDLLNNKYEQLLKTRVFFAHEEQSQINVDDIVIENERLIKK